MEHKCDICNKDFNSEESISQHNSSKHSLKSKKGKISLKRYFIPVSIVFIIILLTLSFFNYTKKPGQYDNFAKCLTDMGAVVYGNDYCSYTGKQLNFFGKSREHLRYVKCIENKALCDSKGIEVTPTWEINGKMYSQVQTFEALTAISGCSV